MSAAIIIHCNLFDACTKYLAHQCNCVSQNSAYLAADIFTEYPYADVYSNRKEPDQPGNIIIKGNGKTERFIINMFSQYYPGKPKYPNSKLDGYKVRKDYFFQCLKKIATIKDLDSIAFPYGIGCGAAGGNWEEYLKIINKFSDYVAKTSKASVYICKLD